MVGLAGEVACVTHGSIVLPLRASKLKSKPGPCSKVSGAHVPHGAHLAGAREEDLGALMQPHGPLSTARAASAAPAATQGSFRSVHREEQEKLFSAKGTEMPFIIFMSTARFSVQSQREYFMFTT